MLSTSPRKHTPHLIISRPEADADDFSRRLKISVSPPPSTRNHIQNHLNHAAQTTKSPTLSHAGKLFNPNTDSISLRHTAEPEVMSDTDSYARGGHSARQLFNPRKDDPVRFSVLARPSATPSTSPRQAPSQAPTSKSSGEYVSASSTSSYATSTLSSSFTLSSTTDGSSAGSGLFEKRKDPCNDAFAGQLKRIYRTITHLEGKIIAEHAIDEPREESARITLKGKTKAKETNDDDAEQRRWLKVIAGHKAYVPFIALPADRA
jgi:protein SMG6